jgi:exopolysaccharide biosynthesis polyprenyl glycosylphosphotransferase
MKREPVFIFKIALCLGDILAISVAFALAYFLRTHVDPRPFYFNSAILEFVTSIVLLIPIWILVFFALGLYQESIYMHRPKEYGRLFIASGIGVMALITYDFFAAAGLFPVRIIVPFAFILCWLMAILLREITKSIRKILCINNIGVLRLLVVGNSEQTTTLIKNLRGNLASGYKVTGVVAKAQYVPDFTHQLRYKTIAEACKDARYDIIVQTEDRDTETIYAQAVNRHLGYMLIPSQEVLMSHLGDIDIIGTQPVIRVPITPLTGHSRLIKRFFDVIVGGILLIITSPFMLVIWVIEMFSGGDPIYKTKRLSRFNKKVKIYKFRTMKNKYNNMMPEQAFAKMGRPELVEEYRRNGDQLDHDPRISKLGQFLRATSLDELPQIWNVVRGDISLVGPRALVPGELAKYPNKNLILSTKSGLTGLAQVSGRRDISFEERRLLDIYYVQNWSLLLDVQILFRTIATVLFRRGAK